MSEEVKVNVIEKLLKKYRRPSVAANALGIEYETFWHWSKRGIPMKHAYDIARKTNGFVSPLEVFLDCREARIHKKNSIAVENDS